MPLIQIIELKDNFNFLLNNLAALKEGKKSYLCFDGTDNIFTLVNDEFDNESLRN